MGDGKRAIATSLGLRYRNTVGRLKFDKGGPTHAMWFGVLNATLARTSGHKGSFEAVADIVEHYGPQVWTDENDELLTPGERDGYMQSLRWPADEEKILGLFRELYDRRQYAGAATDESDLIEQEFRETLAMKHPTSDQRWFKHAANRRLEARRRWRPAAAVRPEPGVTRQIDDLFLTELWIMTQDGLAATMKMGKHQTIADLFAAIENAFAKHNRAPSLGSLRKIVMIFNNLGSSLQAPQVLCHDDHDHQLQLMRVAIWSGYEKHREDIDGEVVIALCTAFFESTDMD